MIHRDTFINKIRSINYTYKNQQKRTQLWKKRGGTHRMFIPLCDLLEDEFVKSALRQAGETEKDIAAFITQYSAS